MEKRFSESIAAARRALSWGLWGVVTAVLRCRSIGVSEPVLLAAFGVLNLGAAHLCAEVGRARGGVRVSRRGREKCGWVNFGMRQVFKLTRHLLAAQVRAK